jgi:hypothetical protein
MLYFLIINFLRNFEFKNSIWFIFAGKIGNIFPHLHWNCICISDSEVIMTRLIATKCKIDIIIEFLNFFTCQNAKIKTERKALFSLILSNTYIPVLSWKRQLWNVDICIAILVYVLCQNREVLSRCLILNLKLVKSILRFIFLILIYQNLIFKNFLIHCIINCFLILTIFSNKPTFTFAFTITNSSCSFSPILTGNSLRTLRAWIINFTIGTRKSYNTFT